MNVESLIRLQGKEYRIVFDFRALLTMEREFGLSLDRMSEVPHFRSMHVMLWAGLRRHQPDLTLDQVADLIELGNMADIEAAVSEAFMGAFPEGASEDTNPRSASSGQTLNAKPTGISVSSPTPMSG